MIPWKRLGRRNVEYLGIELDTPDEEILVDPTADYDSVALIMYHAERVFSKEQLYSYGRLGTLEKEVMKEKLNKRLAEKEGKE